MCSSVLGSLGSQASFSTFHPLSMLVFSVLSNICSYKWEDLDVIWLFCLGGTRSLKQDFNKRNMVNSAER